MAESIRERRRQQALAVADMLETEVDSHTIYSPKDVERWLRPLGLAVEAAGRISFEDTMHAVVAPFRTSRQFERLMQAHPAGGQLAPGEWTGISGYELSGALARLFGATPEGMLGRGFQHRANIRAIRAIAEEARDGDKRS